MGKKKKEIQKNPENEENEEEDEPLLTDFQYKAVVGIFGIALVVIQLVSKL